MCILPSLGRSVTGTAADRTIEVSAYFTSVLIPSFGRAVTDKREHSDTSEKEVYTWFTSEHIQAFVLMLVLRRRWPNIKIAFNQRSVFSRLCSRCILHTHSLNTDIGPDTGLHFTFFTGRNSYWFTWAIFVTDTCGSHTLVPRATLRGVAELHEASGIPQWRTFVTSCYILMKIR